MKSAGLLVFRRKGPVPEVFLAHMGGPFWRNKDAGAWTIPKGEFRDEAPFDAAMREFREETGLVPAGNFVELAPCKQASGKVIHAFAVEWDCDASNITSNTFPLEWPKGSGRIQEFPEVDRAGWFTLDQAAEKIVKGQIPLLDQLRALLSSQAASK